MTDDTTKKPSHDDFRDIWADNNYTIPEFASVIWEMAVKSVKKDE